ncbi:putative heterokaryon incompatibility protein [Triangularia verruculosa]|uniref:Heterokaryon incompatibility protein n=1 Tax=Triangularia verruculosa TaxID=2587418 RepID=A0AAN7AWA8_9PEZI|nr:putative heterokaryon incompatibility protein [Triangularia verruculosa]
MERKDTTRQMSRKWAFPSGIMEHEIRARGFVTSQVDAPNLKAESVATPHGMNIYPFSISIVSLSSCEGVFPTPANNGPTRRSVYHDLNPHCREIRLLRLHLEDNDGFIACDLLPAITLSTAKGKYTAISYCAGDPKRTKQILVNGIHFNVFENLAHVLDMTRDFWRKNCPNKECIIWADQICINQSNLAERSHQVGFMRSIYSSAVQTLICLSTTEVDPRGIEWLVNLHQSVDPDGDFYQYYFHLEYHLRTNLANQQFLNDWFTFYDVFSSPWWTRTWVYQEFISSSNIYFLYGRSSITWKRLSEVLPTLQKYSHFPYFGPAITERQAQVADTNNIVNFFVISKLRFDRVGPFDLMDLLSQSRHLQSSDARDRIYAFLGLVREDYGILPDYSPENTMEKLLVDIATRVVLQDRTLDILSDACRVRGELSPSLPSWVPDWTTKACVRLLPRIIRDNNDQPVPIFPPIVDTGRLEVQGFHIGAPRKGKIGWFVPSRQDTFRQWEGRDELWEIVGAPGPFVLHHAGDREYRLFKEARGARPSGYTSVESLIKKEGLQMQTVVLS